MTYLYEELSAPTRLYIKQCSHCDLKYFGKTILEDIQSYSETVNNSDWLDTKGKERSRKMSEKTKNRDKFECQYCKGMFWKTHLNRWHGENCKHKGV